MINGVMTKTPPKALAAPSIRLAGEVGPDMLCSFNDQVAAAAEADPLVLELTTQGGDAEFGRRLALEIRLLSAAGRRVLFLGKTAVYSAGVTIMAATPAKDRWLTADTLLLVHGRKLVKTIELDGDLRDAERAANRILAEARTGLAAEEEGFIELCAGSRLRLSELRERASPDWYLTAEEAVGHRLVAGLYGPARPPGRSDAECSD